jgi:hypothetical protein
MMPESSFVSFVQPLDFARQNIHLQVSVEVIVSNVPGCTDHVPVYFVLKSLYDVYITLFGATPELDSVCPNGYEGPEWEWRYSPTLSLTSALNGVGGQRHAPAALPPKKDPAPIVQEAGWAPGPVWMGAENLAAIGIRSPDRPARSEIQGYIPIYPKFSILYTSHSNTGRSLLTAQPGRNM